MDGWIAGRVGGWTDGRTDRRTDGWTDEWIDVDFFRGRRWSAVEMSHLLK